MVMNNSKKMKGYKEANKILTIQDLKILKLKKIRSTSYFTSLDIFLSSCRNSDDKTAK
jgi:hypothetical protein